MLAYTTRTRVTTLVAYAALALALLLRSTGPDGLAVFVASSVALAALAVLIGEGTDQLSLRLGAGATGVLQSALGNLPEFFIGVFALRAGLVEVVQSALIGSILANTLLVLGLAFIAGGLRHGAQKFGGEQTRMMSTLLLLAVAAMAIPTVASLPGGPDRGHETQISFVVAIVLLLVFAASIPVSIGRSGPAVAAEAVVGERPWPMSLTVLTLLLAGIASAFASDWFVAALTSTMDALGMSQAFAGLVIVAIAGNAVENVVGVRAMLADRGDLAISLILNSSLQVALALTPVLVTFSLLMGGAALTLVVSPLLVVALGLTALLAAFVVIDGESTWLEGVALVGLYVIIAASVWWGAPISS